MYFDTFKFIRLSFIISRRQFVLEMVNKMEMRFVFAAIDGHLFACLNLLHLLNLHGAEKIP